VSEPLKPPLDPDFVIELPVFQGPLDLLLHLIQKHELPILDLPIAFVTEKYLAYLGVMEHLNLDIASEYLLMAATLAHIKSKMLLPPDPNAQPDEPDAEEDTLDPRAELIRRLLEYQKYKAAAEALGARGIAGRDVFLRGTPAAESQGAAPLAEVGLYKLLDAFQRVVERSKITLSREIDAEQISIQARMTEITERLATLRRASFDELFDGMRSQYEVVVTFLALLEMAKMRMLRVYQADAYSPLYLESAILGEHDEVPLVRADGEDPYAYRPSAAEAPLESIVDDVQVVESEHETGAGSPVPEDAVTAGDAEVAVESLEIPGGDVHPSTPATDDDAS
jgi:segregation and condensation protein A